MHSEARGRSRDQGFMFVLPGSAALVARRPGRRQPAACIRRARREGTRQAGRGGRMARRATMLAFACLALAACATTPHRRRPSRRPHRRRTMPGRRSTRAESPRSGAYGLADRGGGRPLTIDDPVRIASITKLHVALGVMRMVEAGSSISTRDVSDWLGWQLRNPAFPDRPITLRLLLSHRSSLRDGVNYAIPRGTTFSRRSCRPRRSMLSTRPAPSSATPTSISRSSPR